MRLVTGLELPAVAYPVPEVPSHRVWPYLVHQCTSSCIVLGLQHRLVLKPLKEAGCVVFVPCKRRWLLPGTMQTQMRCSGCQSSGASLLQVAALESVT